MPVGRGGGVNSMGVKGRPSCPPLPLPTGILYSPHQETKMAARRTQRLTSTISRKKGDCEQSTVGGLMLMLCASKNQSARAE